MGSGEIFECAEISQARGDEVQWTCLVGEWTFGAGTLSICADVVPTHVSSKSISNTFSEDASHDCTVLLALFLSTQFVLSRVILLDSPDEVAQTTIDCS